MLTSSFSITVIALLTSMSRVGSAPIQEARFMVDTGAVSEPAPVIPLTSQVLTAYATVEKVLATYWAEHPEQAKTAFSAHMHQHTIANVGDGPFSMTIEKKIFDYEVLAQQNTAVATLFAKHHVTPAQFEPTQDAVYRAIAALELKQRSDSSTIMGKNMILVQAHQKELSIDWEETRQNVQSVNELQGKLPGMLLKGVQGIGGVPVKIAPPK